MIVFFQVTHWHSPQFHAYFPTGNSYPAICADILSDAIGCIGFSWVSTSGKLIFYYQYKLNKCTDCQPSQFFVCLVRVLKVYVNCRLE